ncbi:MAG: ATP synthase F1 subunit gamma [Candidatus Omnitrophota bacterium]
MAGIKVFNTKIRSLKNTRKITKTMKMVSASKLRKAQEAQANAKSYAQKITSLVSRISASVDTDIHPLLKRRPENHKALILIITSDRGLCGAFNNNANRMVNQWIIENHNDYPRIDVSCCGKRGYLYFRKRIPIQAYYEKVTINPKFSDAVRIGEDLSRLFISGEYDEIYLTYNQFFSPLSQKTIFEKILPIDPKALIAEREAQKTDYIFEPAVPEMLSFLVPHFLYFTIYFALLENSAGEHGARMSAMDNATNNAGDLIDRYTLLRNRARQAAITTELTEIISGAQALN